MLIRKGLLLDIMSWEVGAYSERALIRAWALILGNTGENSLSCGNVYRFSLYFYSLRK